MLRFWHVARSPIELLEEWKEGLTLVQQQLTDATDPPYRLELLEEEDNLKTLIEVAQTLPAEPVTVMIMIRLPGEESDNVELPDEMLPAHPPMLS